MQYRIKVEQVIPRESDAGYNKFESIYEQVVDNIDIGNLVRLINPKSIVINDGTICVEAVKNPDDLPY